LEAATIQYEDLTQFIDQKSIEGLNFEKDFPPENALIQKDDSVIQSESDPQLLIKFSFDQHVKIHHFVIKGGKDAATNPKTLKLFVNQHGIDFSAAENDEPTQSFELRDKDFGQNIDLRFVKFQYVKDLAIFVEDNNGGDVSQISQITFYGLSIHAFKTSDIKPVSEDG